jgi:hypothetical protein
MEDRNIGIFLFAIFLSRVFMVVARRTRAAERPPLNDPAHGRQRWPPRRSRRVRGSAWLGSVVSVTVVCSILVAPLLEA